MQNFYIAAISIIVGTLLGVVSNLVADIIQPHLARQKKLIISFFFALMGFLILLAGLSEYMIPRSDNRPDSFAEGANNQPSVTLAQELTENTTSEPRPTLSTNVPTSIIPTSIPSQSPQIPTPDAVVLTTLNMRSGPSKSYTIITSYPTGTHLKVLGKDEKGNWIKVEAPDGNVGWMSGSGLQINVQLSSVAIAAAPPLPTAAPTRVEANPPAQPAQAGAKPAPKPSVGNRFDSTWKGTTDRGGEISFTIKDGVLCCYALIVPGPEGCESFGGVGAALGESNVEADGTIYYSGAGTFSGKMSIEGVASGTYYVYSPNCSIVDRMEGNWSANRQ